MTNSYRGGYYWDMETQQNEALEVLIKKLENGELTQEQELEFLKELNFSYDVLNKFLEELKIAKLSAEMK